MNNLMCGIHFTLVGIPIQNANGVSVLTSEMINTFKPTKMIPAKIAPVSISSALASIDIWNAIDLFELLEMSKLKLFAFFISCSTSMSKVILFVS